MEEAEYTIAQANAPLDKKAASSETDLLPQGRRLRDGHAGAIDFIDVSPKQLVSVAAALIPFLENDDANRALMGSNMQRRRAAAPGRGAARRHRHGSGGRARFGRHDRAAAPASVDQIDATRIVIRARADDRGSPAVDIYNLLKFQRSNQNTCITQRPLVKVGDQVEAGDIIADGPSTSWASWRSAERARRVHAVERLQLRGLDPDLRAHRARRRLHLDPHRGIRGDGARHKLGPEEITRDIPNVGEEALKNLDEAGIVYIGAEVKPGDILVGKVTPKGESPMTPRKAAARHLRREGLGRARHLAQAAAGVSGTVVEVRVFTAAASTRTSARSHRAGGDRALAKDRRREGDPRARSTPPRELLAQGAARPRGRPTTQVTRGCSTIRRASGGRSRQDDKVMADIEALKKQFDDVKRARGALRGQGRRSCSAATSCRPA
jgi:DNA-directed RNA polymerase subunit beta